MLMSDNRCGMYETLAKSDSPVSQLERDGHMKPSEESVLFLHGSAVVAIVVSRVRHVEWWLPFFHGGLTGSRSFWRRS